MGALNTQETPVDNGRHLWTMDALNTGKTHVDNWCLKHRGDTCGEWVP